MVRLRYLWILFFRHVLDEGSTDYKVIMLNRKYLVFRVIKVSFILLCLTWMHLMDLKQVEFVNCGLLVFKCTSQISVLQY